MIYEQSIIARRSHSFLSAFFIWGFTVVQTYLAHVLQYHPDLC